MNASIDAFERRLVRVTQEGLPLVARPYAHVAAALGVSEEMVIERLKALLARGAIRRIGAVPNHYAIGYTANGMSVWDIDDAVVDQVGELLGRQANVSHCYRRPRHLPDWPYNLFAMVHGRQRERVNEEIADLAALIERACGPVIRARDVLFSSQILKKTGLRLGADPKGK